MGGGGGGGGTERGHCTFVESGGKGCRFFFFKSTNRGMAYLLPCKRKILQIFAGCYIFNSPHTKKDFFFLGGGGGYFS